MVDVMATEGAYFVMSVDITDTSARITSTSGLPRRARNWITGAALEVAVPTPVQFVIEAEDEGTLGAYYTTGAPLMSRELVDCLRSCGVDTLELHDAVITEEVSGTEHRTHLAVNVVGLIAMYGSAQKSSLEGLSTWVHRGATIDPAAAQGALLFRLKESPSQVVLHRSVRDAIIALKLPLLRFTALEDFSG